MSIPVDGSNSFASWKNDAVSLKPKASSASAVVGLGVTVYLCSLFGASVWFPMHKVPVFLNIFRKIFEILVL